MPISWDELELRTLAQIARKSQVSPSLTYQTLNEAVNTLQEQAAELPDQHQLDLDGMRALVGTSEHRWTGSSTGRIICEGPNIRDVSRMHYSPTPRSEYTKTDYVECVACKLVHHIKHRKVVECQFGRTTCPKCGQKKVVIYYRIDPRQEEGGFVTDIERNQT